MRGVLSSDTNTPRVTAARNDIDSDLNGVIDPILLDRNLGNDELTLEAIIVL